MAEESSNILDRLRILIVDDSTVIRKILAKLLEESHIPVDSIEEADNGRTALKMVEFFHPHIVLCDFHMPLVSGVEFAKQVRAHPKRSKTKIIMITSDNTKKNKTIADEIPLDGFVGKPFTSESVLAELMTVYKSLHLS